MNTITDTLSEYHAKRFQGLDLHSQCFNGLEFEECEFYKCNLSEATFARSKFIECRFVECNLSLLKVTTSKFREVSLEQCKAIGINWTQASWQKLVTSAQLNFQKCILNDSSFFGLTLEEFVIEDCIARDVDFREANIASANCRRCDFSGAQFRRTNLTGADLTDAINYDIDVFDNAIKGAKFSRQEALRLLDSLEIELID